MSHFSFPHLLVSSICWPAFCLCEFTYPGMIAHAWDYTICQLFCLLFSPCTKFLRFVHVVACISISFFLWLKVFHGMTIPCIVCPFTGWWRFELFPLFYYYEKWYYEYSHASIYVDIYILISLGIPQSGTAG